MIFQETVLANAIKATNMVASGNAYIEMTEAMARITGPGLYSDKEKTTFQELIQNSRDGCVMFDLPIKIEVCLPTKMEPYLWVKDHGCGMTPEEVLKYCLGYGVSSKRNSQKAMGHKGLGMKIVYAEPQVIIESVKNGQLFKGLVQKNGKNIPEMFAETKDSEGNPSTVPAPADWPHGTRIGFKVDNSRLHVFERALRKVLYWYPKGLIKVIGNSSFETDHIEMVNGVGKAPDSFNIYVKMGNEGYRVNREILESAGFTSFELDSEYGLTLNNMIGKVFEVPMGAVLPNTSREGLEATSSITMKGLRDLLDTQKAIVDKKLESLKSGKLADFTKFWAEYDTNNSHRAIQNIFAKDPVYGGVFMRNYSDVAKEELKKILPLFSESKEYLVRHNVTKISYSDTAIEDLKSKNPKFLILDKTYRTMTAIKTFQAQKPGEPFLLLKAIEGKAAELKKELESQGYSNVTLSSTIELPPIVKEPKVEKESVDYEFKYLTRYSNFEYSTFTKSTEDQLKTTFYVKVDSLAVKKDEFSRKYRPLMRAVGCERLVLVKEAIMSKIPKGINSLDSAIAAASKKSQYKTGIPRRSHEFSISSYAFDDCKRRFTTDAQKKVMKLIETRFTDDGLEMLEVLASPRTHNKLDTSKLTKFQQELLKLSIIMKHLGSWRDEDGHFEIIEEQVQRCIEAM